MNDAMLQCKTSMPQAAAGDNGQSESQREIGDLRNVIFKLK